MAPMGLHHHYLLLPTIKQLSSKLPFIPGAEPPKLEVTGLSSDSSPKFLEVHRVLKMALFLNRAVTEPTVPSDVGCYPRIGGQPIDHCHPKTLARFVVSEVHDLHRHNNSETSRSMHPKLPNSSI
jgi:hypothetical protein